ncbi:unnamed protein product [Ixodes pacificus]
MGCCCAVGCSNRNTTGFRLFKLPKDKKRRRVWIANIRRNKWTPTSRSEICESQCPSGSATATESSDTDHVSLNGPPDSMNVSTVFCFCPEC